MDEKKNQRLLEYYIKITPLSDYGYYNIVEYYSTNS
jgi:hypothetical protein